MTNNSKITLLGTPGVSTNILYQELVDMGFEVQVILEDKISNKKIIKNRIKKVGLRNVLGQLFFMVIVVPFLKRNSKDRIAELLKGYDLDSNLYLSKATRIDSVNNGEVIQVIDVFKPELILVSGTRIIQNKILRQIKVPVVNIHAGVTPFYRGVHGGYWALYNDDADRCGTTLHFVDEGIDTGVIIDQAIIKIADQDNFCTYPILQLLKGIDLLQVHAGDIISNQIERKNHHEKGALYYHPRLFQYLRARRRFGVR